MKKSVDRGPIDNRSALVQLTAWHRTGNNPFSDQMLTSLIGVYASQGFSVINGYSMRINKLTGQVDTSCYRWCTSCLQSAVGLLILQKILNKCWSTMFIQQIGVETQLWKQAGAHLLRRLLQIHNYSTDKEYIYAIAKDIPCKVTSDISRSPIHQVGVTLDLRTYVHPGRTCRFTYAVRWSDIPRKSRHWLTYFHFLVLIW